MPKNITARPTTDFARENIFNVLENMLDFDGLRALDLFAGTGAVSIELLSRGCGGEEQHSIQLHTKSGTGAGREKPDSDKRRCV